MEEMWEAVGNHAHSFGLLRMTFGVGTMACTKFICVHAVDGMNSGNFTAIERERGLMSKPQMFRVIHSFARIAAEVHIQSAKECSVEHVISKLCDMGETVTVENFEAAVAYHREQNPELGALEQERKHQMRLVNALAVPRASVAPPEVVVFPTGPTGRLRERVKLHAIGDMVEFWSESSRKWVLDGEVEEVVVESRKEKGYCIQAGSVKISFDNGRRAEWLPPSQVKTNVRPSARPRPPAPMMGELWKEAHRWTTYRHKRYVELSKGFLRWWDSKEDAKHGRPASNTVYLLGLQHERQGLELKFRTATSMGAFYTFEAVTEEEAEAWSVALWAHAGYTNQVHDFSQIRSNSPTSNVSSTTDMLRFIRMGSAETQKLLNTPRSRSGSQVLGGA